jgi:translation initiation factor 2B subunit (eIF-2B alpha/beta/delta family)
MLSDLQALADKVKEDSVSGSSETATYVLRTLHEILSNSEPSADQLRDFSKLLRQAKPAMAPLSNIAGLMEAASQRPDPNQVALGSVEKLMSNEKTATDRIAKNMMEKVEGTVLTMSYSGTVVNVLKHVSKHKGIKVTVAESLPLGEGRRTANILAEAGIEVTLVADSMVFAEARSSDLCLVGADAITPHALVNKVGTYAIALAAMQAGIPTYVASSSLKVTSGLRPDWVIEQRTEGRLSERTQLFEPTPLELITEVITETGATRPGRLFRD